jgi:hypothetical protein
VIGDPGTVLKKQKLIDARGFELITLAIDNSPAVSQLVTEKLLDLVPGPNSVFRR